MHVVRVTLVALCLSVVTLSCGAAQAATDQTSTAADAGTTSGRNQGVMNKFYAVTLMTSFTPVATKKLAKQFPDHVVYQKKSVVFGKELYLIRLGFFPSYAAATAMKDKLLDRFPGAWPTEVPEAEQANALGIGVVAPSGVARAAGAESGRTIKAGKAAGSGIFVINLDSANVPEKLVRVPMPVELNAYRTYVLSATIKGKTQYYFRLGFFPTQSDAEQARSFLTRTYAGSSIVEVSREEQALAATPDAAVAATTAGVPGPAPATAGGGEIQGAEIESQAGELLEQGRDHITAGEYILAIQKLNRLLTLPHNKFTDDAIEYIGVARERGGQFELAREMYENYLRVNPDTEGAERVRQRLASMAGASAEPTPALRPAQDKAAPVKTVFGSLSQTYHRTESTASATSTQPELFTDAQRVLINYLDLNARYQGGDYDNRVVLRDQHTYNWLDTSLTEHRVTAVYLELKDKKRDYSARFGRQPGNTGGVLGIFDGASATYNISPIWHISGSTGVPKENKLDAQRYLYSVSTDFGPLAQHWYGGLYYVYQFVEGVEDRNAVGAEMRYFEPGHSVYTLFDYDLSYSALNIAVLQANWQTESNTSYNLLLDHRKSPALQASNVLNGASILVDPMQPTLGSFIPSYSDLSQRYTYAELREFARLHTPEANFYDFSVSRPVSPRLQLGGGINMYNFSESAETPIASLVPGTGNTYIYSLRAIGTGLVFDKDISVLTLSHTSGDTVDGNGIVLSNKSIFKNKWTIDVDLRLSKQNSRFPETTTNTPTGPVTTAATDSDNTLVSPTVRFGYRMKQTAVFEIEYGQDRTRSRDLINLNSEETVTKTMHYSVGYRWTF